jgi:hypothetical protein
MTQKQVHNFGIKKPFKLIIYNFVRINLFFISFWTFFFFLFYCAGGTLWHLKNIITMGFCKPLASRHQACNIQFPNWILRDKCDWQSGSSGRVPTSKHKALRSAPVHTHTKQKRGKWRRWWWRRIREKSLLQADEIIVERFSDFAYIKFEHIK